MLSLTFHTRTVTRLSQKPRQYLPMSTELLKHHQCFPFEHRLHWTIKYHQCFPFEHWPTIKIYSEHVSWCVFRVMQTWKGLSVRNMKILHEIWISWLEVEKMSKLKGWSWCFVTHALNVENLILMMAIFWSSSFYVQLYSYSDSRDLEKKKERSILLSRRGK